MIQALFGVLLGGGLLFGLVKGQGDAALTVLLGAAREGVETAFSLAGSFALFCGMMGILRASGAADALARKAEKPLQRLLGRGANPEALSYVAMNLTCNLLGLGNAATPMGLEAARRLGGGDRANNALCMFLVINASSVQLMPTTVIALRAAAGSADPGAVVLPTIIATGISTLVGILSCKGLEKWL